MRKMRGKEDSRPDHQSTGSGNQKTGSNPSTEHEADPAGWRRDEPEEVRRARTTGGTHHQTSQEVKEGNGTIQVERRPKSKPKKKNPASRNKTPPPVLFVDQTKGGILAKRLQEAENRLAVLTGYRIKVT